MSATCVADATPGSGTAARAAVEMGIEYLGLARNSHHENWLNNAADTHAMQLISTSGSVLQHSDLSSALTCHFKHILEELALSAKADDAEPEDGCDPSLTM